LEKELTGKRKKGGRTTKWKGRDRGAARQEGEQTEEKGRAGATGESVHRETLIEESKGSQTYVMRGTFLESRKSRAPSVKGILRNRRGHGKESRGEGDN